MKASAGTMAAVVLQIMVVDMVFAIDSVLTAVGLTQMYIIIIIAMTISIGLMMFYAGTLAELHIRKHPSVKMLALAFLVLVGRAADRRGLRTRRSSATYVYFAILFSLAVEGLNFRRQANAERKKARRRRPNCLPPDASTP